MASLFPNLSSPPSLVSGPRRPRNALRGPTIYPSVPPLSSPLTKLESPPVRDAKHDNDPAMHDKQKQQQQQKHHHHHHDKNDFYLNLGVAVRTLREDLPTLFSRDLNYDIYRDDITFADPLNTFQGIDNYRLIFWALRFHGRMLFREIELEVFRVWQPSENVILIRWNLRGVPRVPWETTGEFQGTSRYKLDRRGKIYEHKVDNLAFNFPRMAPAGPATVLDLVAAAACPPASPNLSFLRGDPLGETYSCSWVEFYRAVRQTLDRGGHLVVGVNDGLITCP